MYGLFLLFFFFKQKTAYEMRISDWSSDVCSSDLLSSINGSRSAASIAAECAAAPTKRSGYLPASRNAANPPMLSPMTASGDAGPQAGQAARIAAGTSSTIQRSKRSAEHTSELQSLMRNSYAVFCLKKK